MRTSPTNGGLEAAYGEQEHNESVHQGFLHWWLRKVVGYVDSTGRILWHDLVGMQFTRCNRVSVYVNFKTSKELKVVRKSEQCGLQELEEAQEFDN